jgi:hypothetical protein
MKKRIGRIPYAKVSWESRVASYDLDGIGRIWRGDKVTGYRIPERVARKLWAKHQR